jgi:hypothetical protein
MEPNFEFTFRTAMDMYLPLFTILEFIFYFGWLKVSNQFVVVFVNKVAFDKNVVGFAASFLYGPGPFHTAGLTFL